MQLKEKSDEELMILYMQGDTVAFDQLYYRHKAKVYGYLKQRLSSQQSADEVFQTVFLKIHSSRATFDAKEKFLPWMFAIIKHALFDHLRKGQSESRKLDAYKNATPLSGQILSENSLSSRIDEEILRLDSKEQDLIDKRYNQDLDFDQIALINKKSSVSVRQSVSRITRKLRMILKGNSA